jgi:hypothetical protein
LVDISLIQARLADVVGRLHYQNLDEVPGLIGRNTTAEVVADFIWAESQCAPPARLDAVTGRSVGIARPAAAITKELAP